MSEIEDTTGMEFVELSQQMYLGKLDIVDSHINEGLGMLKKLEDVVSALVDDTLSEDLLYLHGRVYFKFSKFSTKLTLCFQYEVFL